MSDASGYAVFLFPQALEALGAAIRPYLLPASADGPHLLCRGIDISGAFAELELLGQTGDGRELRVELMLPASMIRMVVSVQGDEHFGFVPRVAPAPVTSQTMTAPATDAPPTPVAPPRAG
jgi:hypothetical protein